MQQISVRSMLIIFNLPHMDNKSNLWLNKSYVRRQLKWWNAFSAETFTYICTKRWTLLRCDKIQLNSSILHAHQISLLSEVCTPSIRNQVQRENPDWRGHATWLLHLDKRRAIWNSCITAQARGSCLQASSWLDHGTVSSYWERPLNNSVS